MRTKAALQGQRGQLLQVDFSKAREGGCPLPSVSHLFAPSLGAACYVFMLCFFFDQDWRDTLCWSCQGAPAGMAARLTFVFVIELQENMRIHS